MIRQICIAAAFAAGVASVSGQNIDESSARALFFSGLEEYKAKGATPIANPRNRAEEAKPATRRTARPPRSRIKVARSNPQLGVRYALLKLQGAQSVEVPPNTVFRSGERVQLKIDVNDSGYLYLVSQGTSGKWSVLYPSSQTADGSNRVSPGQSYHVPPKGSFSFKGAPGTEKLFLVLSKLPESELNELIYNLRDGKSAPDKHGSDAAPPTMLAQNRQIDDPLITRMRASATRDLVFEAPEAEETSKATTASGTRDAGVYV